MILELEITGYKIGVICLLNLIKLGINRWSWFKLNNKINGFTISIKRV
jgi:hypothetical protein